MDGVYQQTAKYKRLHLNLEASVALSHSEEGSVSLHHPLVRSAPSYSQQNNMEPRYRGHARRPFQPPRRTQNSNSLNNQEGPRYREGCSTANIDRQQCENNNTQEEFLVGIQASLSSKSSLDSKDSNSCGVEIVKVEKSSQSLKMCSVLGGFTSATAVHKESDETSSYVNRAGSLFMSNENQSKNARPNSNKKEHFNKAAYSDKIQKPGKKWIRDANQSTITSFMSLGSSSSSVSETGNRLQSNVMSERDHTAFERNCASLPADTSECIVYGKISKMYSPIKQVSQSVYVVSDESSPDSSQDHAGARKMGYSDADKTRCSVSKVLFPATLQTPCSSSISATTMLKHSTGISQNARPLKNHRSKRSRMVPYTKKGKLKSSQIRALACDVDFDKADDSDFVESPASIPPVREVVKVGKTFGLLNDSKVSVVRENHFARLPPEVVENIFCRMPMADMCLNMSHVCQAWNDIISDKKFIPWKKSYYKLKLGQKTLIDWVQTVIRDENMLMPSLRLVSLLRFVEKMKRILPENNAHVLLKNHPKYSLAQTLLNLQKCSDSNPWCLICALVLVSSKVQDICTVLQLLTSSGSGLFCQDVLECLYCIATFLLAFKRHDMRHAQNNSQIYEIHPVIDLSCSMKSSIVRGLHYRLFYALYLYENASISSHAMLQETLTANSSGQQSIVKYSFGETEVRLTHEQMRIIKYTPNPDGEVIKIFAFAGSGKTTTLVRYAQMRPNLKFLLIVFNRSVCDHAQTKFPRNVTCKTGHSLAYGVTGQRYRAANKLNTFSMRVYDIAMALAKLDNHKENLYIRAKCVMETLKTFMSSADETITIDHAPTQRIGDNDMPENIDDHSRMIYVSDAKSYWCRMKDLNDRVAKMTHDGYLKLYQLECPSLNHFDIILIDEAQDLTPVMLEIIQRQRKPRIFVGDQHQQIYSFRGAVNAMQGVRSDRVFYLTQSFRFGPEISQVANTILEVLKNEHTKNLVGHGKPDKINGEQKGQVAILCRSNFNVFSEAVKTCVYSDEPVRVAFVGGVDGFGFPVLMDIYNLMVSPQSRQGQTHEIGNKFIAGFHTMADLEKYAKRTMDWELLGKIQIVRTFNNNLPMCLTKIRQKCVHDMTQADIVFSTVHKAKGLEFATVKIADDFVSSVDFTSLPETYQQNNKTKVDKDEVNLLYVGVTRAKHSLIMSSSVWNIMCMLGGGCMEMRLTEELRKEGLTLESMVEQSLNDDDDEPADALQTQAVTLYRPTVTLSNKKQIPHSIQSPALLKARRNEFCHLFGIGDS